MARALKARVLPLVLEARARPLAALVVRLGSLARLGCGRATLLVEARAPLSSASFCFALSLLFVQCAARGTRARATREIYFTLYIFHRGARVGVCITERGVGRRAQCRQTLEASAGARYLVERAVSA